MFHYRYNKLHGIQKTICTSVWKFTHYINNSYMKYGIPHGSSITKRPNNNDTALEIIEKYCYNKGIKIGWSIEKHFNYAANYTQKLYINDIWTGDIKIYKNGIINSIGNNKNGIYTNYFIDTTNIKSVKSFVDKKLDGISKFYYLDGSIQITGNYKDGWRHGTFRDYDATGKCVVTNWSYGIKL
jgi:antitoxin component YwqK of YwqJK toxin-antitoxin module